MVSNLNRAHPRFKAGCPPEKARERRPREVCDVVGSRESRRHDGAMDTARAFLLSLLTTSLLLSPRPGRH